jgi:putative ABC transport system substrate-binding protein
MFDMKRREFITLLGAGVWPRVVRAQPSQMRKVGFLGANTPAAASHLAAAFVARLRQLGWIEGTNVAIEYRWAAGQTEKFGVLAAELVGAGAEVIVTSGNAPAIAAARTTRTIPIVLASSADIINTGLVKSLSHPGGNVTGLTFAPEDTVGKRLELLKEAVPGLSRVAVLYNPDANPEQVLALRQVAPKLSVALTIIQFKALTDLDTMNALPERSEIGALFVVSDPLVFVNRIAINQFALRERLPTVHMLREYAADGGMMAYGPHFPDFFRRAADFVDKILKGTRADELPVERPTIFRFIVNLKIAKTLGLDVPPTLLARADEVIE